MTYCNCVPPTIWMSVIPWDCGCDRTPMMTVTTTVDISLVPAVSDPIRARLDAIQHRLCRGGPSPDLAGLFDALHAVLDLCDEAADKGGRCTACAYDIRAAIAEKLGVES